MVKGLVNRKWILKRYYRYQQLEDANTNNCNTVSLVSLNLLKNTFFK